MAEVIALYDEGCTVCTCLAAWLERHGRGVQVVPIGSALGDRMLGDVAPTARYATFHVVDARGRLHSGGRAVPLVLDALAGGRPAASLARRFPRATSAAYDAFAARRRVFSRLVPAGCATRASRARAG